MYETEPFLYDYDFETASTRITIKSLTSIVKKESLHNGLQRKRGGGGKSPWHLCLEIG